MGLRGRVGRDGTHEVRHGVPQQSHGVVQQRLGRVVLEVVLQVGRWRAVQRVVRLGGDRRGHPQLLQFRLLQALRLRATVLEPDFHLRREKHLFRQVVCTKTTTLY